jgi:tetratricopeptide (TPR) repeat protein/transcriptional regulator with XRE-family HTH domain
VAEQLALSFAGLLRQLRAEAGLTQEELAQAAGVGTRSVSDLERGVHATAHKDTAGLLAGALGLAGPVRAVFVLAARGRAPAAEVLAARQGQLPGAFAAAATRALPRDIAAFTGRQAELARLMGALATAAAAGGGVVGIHAIDGMAGIGKTAFAVHAAHRLTGSFPDGQFFLPLHAHTAGQRPVDPADALASLLLTAGVPTAQIPPGLEARAARWRDVVAGKQVLLLLDDAASHEQVRPLLPGTAGSLVLVTSRRRLAALEDAAVISLDTLSPGEAAALLARLAARPGMRPGDVAVGDITRLCGYLPLAIGMIASQLRHHPAWSAAGLADELAAGRDRLALLHAENLSVAAAFELSYADLTPAQQRLFRHLGLVHGPSVDAYASAALDGIALDTARRHLNELYDQHLLTEPAPGRYQLHDLLRHHARTLVTADDPADSDIAAGRLLGYYLHTALAAGQHFAVWTATYHRKPPGEPPAHGPDLATREHAAAWLEVERLNLHAAVDHAARCGQAAHAVQIPAAIANFLLDHGHWAQASALHKTALAAARQAGDKSAQASASNQLGVVQQRMGDHRAAAASFEQAVALFGDVEEQPGLAYALNNLGLLHALTGDHRAAAAAHRHALHVARRTRDRLAEADTLNCLGVAQRLTGDYAAAAGGQQHALALFRELDHPWGQADALNQLGLAQQQTGDHPAAAASLQHALALFRELGHRLGQAETLNSLGDLASGTADNERAGVYYSQALAIARDIGAPLEEARALEGLGRAGLQDDDIGHAVARLRQALAIYHRLGSPAAASLDQLLHDEPGYDQSPAPPASSS